MFQTPAGPPPINARAARREANAFNRCMREFSKRELVMWLDISFLGLGDRYFEVTSSLLVKIGSGIALPSDLAFDF
jgi:hypothetical protein